MKIFSAKGEAPPDRHNNLSSFTQQIPKAALNKGILCFPSEVLVPNVKAVCLYSWVSAHVGVSMVIISPPYFD